MTRPMTRRRLGALCAALMLAAPTANADEGMWTFDHAPLAAIRDRHGVTLSPEWLAQLQQAAVNYGASASFVSARGLLLTNHHVALRCIQQVSSAGRDLAAHGFLAERGEDELRCPGGMARGLVSSDDVSTAVSAAAAQGRDDEDRNARRKAEIARQEAECRHASGLQCEVVALYSGALHQLYRYREWDDVRLVFAPEYQAAFYGGDADNFVYPRFALDVALFRVYDQGRPVQPAAHLRLATEPLVEGDVVFAAGHPGQTQRLLTVAQLTALRDVQLPLMLASARAQQALLHAYSARSPEAARQALGSLFGTENWLKATAGEFEALRDPALMAAKAADEARLRAGHARLALPGDPWRQIEEATQRQTARAREHWAVGYGYQTLFQMAGQLVELANERRLPEAQRLAEYRDAKLPALERRLAAQVPIYPDLEVARLAGMLRESLGLLGAEHRYVRAALAGETPETAAERLVRGSRLGDAALRSQLLRGGVAAIEAFDDPLLLLARQVYPLRRELARYTEEQVDTPIQRAAESLGQARFAIDGFAVAPDATGTLRLSFGRVAGYRSNGVVMPWKSTWGGWLARADSFDAKPPFDLPPRIAQSRASIDSRTPLDFVLTADITGGSSGSPVVNRRGEWVGLIFDTNLEALGGSYAYSDQRARAIAVHAQGIVEALQKVYGAAALADELRGPAPAAR